jgi:ribosomal protein S18 acetylase RimI-like enzyme
LITDHYMAMVKARALGIWQRPRAVGGVRHSASHFGSMKTVHINNRHRSQIFRLLQEDVDANLFLIDIMLRRGITNLGHEEWRGIFRNDELMALAVSMGRPRRGKPSLLLFACGCPELCESLGKREGEAGGTAMLLGPREPLDGIWRGMGEPPPLVRYDQRLYVSEEAPAGPTIPLRYAEASDLACLVEYSAEMMREDLNDDPLGRDPSKHIAAVQSRIRKKKTLVGEMDGSICFMLDIGTHFRLGSQVGGTYVPPRFRGKGIATKGMREACHRLLRTCDRVTLHVNEANGPAVRCYLNSGFKPGSPYRLATFHHPD